VVGKLHWDDNYVAFIDALLQLQILQLDSRSLYIPSAIQRLVIHPHRHKEQLLTLDNNMGTFKNIIEKTSLHKHVYVNDNVLLPHRFDF
jgi:fatty acid synthase